MRYLRIYILLFVGACSTNIAETPPKIEIVPVDTKISAGLRGLSVVDEKTAWASGTSGTWLRTVDGENWQSDTVPGAGEYQFRDIEAFSATSALLLLQAIRQKFIKPPMVASNG